MNRLPLTDVVRYGAALLAVFLATVARQALDPVLGDLFPFATLFFAVLIVAGYGGRGPAVLATVVGAVVSARYLLPPRDSFAVSGLENQAGLALYMAVGLGIALLGGTLRTARHRAEGNADEAVRQREQMRITLSSIGDAVLVTDAEGRVTSLNPVAEALTGWPSAEAASQPLPSVFRILNEETRRESENPALRALREGVIVGLANHTVLVARDGTERPIDDSAAPIRDSAGRVVGTVLVFRDIGERRRAEAEVRRAGEQARTILESITDAFCALDRDWRFVYVNRHAEALLDRSADDLLGKNHWEEYPATIGSDFERHYRRAVADGVAVSFETFYQPHDRWYEVHAYPSPAGLSVYFRDVTGRKRSEEERARLVAASEQQRRTYETALSNTPDFNYVFDLDGRLTFVNASLLSLWRKSLDEAVGKDLFELDYPPDLAARLHRQIRQVIDTRRPVRDETPYTSHLGERQYEYIFVPVLAAGGAVEAVVGSTRDITERKRAERELAGLVQRITSLVDNTPLAVIEWDAEFVVTRWSGQAENVFGWTAAEVIGGRIANLPMVYEEDRAKLEAVMARLLDPANKFVVSRNRNNTKTGEVVSCEWYNSVIHDEAGRMVAVLSLVLDVTERDRAESALRESEQRFHSLADSVPVHVWMDDERGRGVLVNARYLEYSGRTTDGVGNESWRDIVHPDDKDRYLAEYQAAAAARAEHRAEVRLRGRDGAYRWFEIIGRPRFEGERFAGYVGISLDVTDRRQAQGALREVEARFAAVVNHSPSWIFAKDRQGRFVLANLALARLVGRDLDGIVGRPDTDFFPPEVAEKFARDDAEVLATGRPVTYEETFPHGGSAITALTVKFPLADRDGKPYAVCGIATDITTYKQAELALRQSEERFRHLAGAVPQIVWITGPDDTVEFFNERWFQYTGLSPEQSYSPEGWRSHVHPDDVSRMTEASARSHATGEPFEAEFRLKDRSGVYRWHLGRSVEVRDGEGRVLRRFGTSTDIHDRKRDESDARFLAEASATLAAIVDEAGTLQKVAHLAVPSFADWCSVDLAGEDGLPRRLAVAHVDPAKVELAHDLQRRYPTNPDAPHGAPRVIRTGLPAMVSEISEEMIVAGARDEDHLRILRELGLRSYMCVPLRGRSGTLGAISFVAAESGRCYDNKDLRLAEDLASRAAIALENARLFREVKESEGRFRQLADAMPQIVWTARPDGSFDYYNKRWYEFTGRPQGEGGDESWEPILHPDDVRHSLDRWDEAVRSGRPYEAEYRFRDHLTGAYRWHLGRALPVRDESDRIVKWFGTSTDIDDRKQAEGALRAARDEAEHANQAKNQFLAVLSHELRTPLNPILLAASSMLDRSWEPGEIRPTLEMIRQNVNLQARLIDDLLDVMRIVRGKMPLHWEVADCHRLIEQAIQICRSEVFGGELRMEINLAATQRHVNADAARLQQVFWNLIKNAVKFTPGGGAITIRTSNGPGPGGPEDQIVIEVGDTGIGIEPEILPRIFDPFQQGETTITRKFGGLGLGLAICKGIVDAHGGTLSAESQGKDQGTTFRVVLKALPEQASGGNGEPTAGATRPGSDHPPLLRILVVEDEPATLRLMARLLRGLGHEVTTASTIASAHEAFVGGEFDLIVSDIGLPDGTGLELMRRVVALRGQIPAIALTGYGMEDDIVRSREAGFSAHLTKPIDFTKLEAMIRQVAT